MCGIAVLMGCSNLDCIDTITQAMVHRGPDHDGYYKTNTIQLGMRRLSIIDLQNGQQPIFNENRDKCIILNGEIYNYRELREYLLQKGHLFSTQTDTEVIIHLYEEYGYQCVNYLRGMFAFVILDGEKLFIARDRFGIKPLYYTFIQEKYIFLVASEIKGILACQDVPVSLNMQTVADAFLLGFPIGANTLFTAISSLQPGHFLRVMSNHGTIEIEDMSYYQPSFTINASIDIKDAEQKLLSVLVSACNIHLRSDVEVGLALSGGLDSSLLAMILHRYLHKSLQTFTIAGSSEHPDAFLSRQVAALTDSQHTTFRIDFNEYFNAIPGLLAAEEKITNLSGLPFYLLCKYMSSQVKVFFSGEGADELFGGYKVYLDRASFLPNVEKKLHLLRDLRLCPSNSVLRCIRNIFASSSFEEYLDQLFSIYFKDQLVYWHLETADKYAMSASLECRVPYLDHEVVDFVATLPHQFRANKDMYVHKYILKRVAINLFGEKASDLVLRQKMGFPSTGNDYFNLFKSFCEDMLPDQYLSNLPIRSMFTNKAQLLLFNLFIEIFEKWRGIIPSGFDLKEYMKERSSHDDKALIQLLEASQFGTFNLGEG